MNKPFPVYIRRAVQTAIFAGLFIVIWMTKYPLRGFVNPSYLFQADPLVMVMTAIAERVLLAGLIFSAVTLAGAYVLGRVFCGWICPLGAVMDAEAAIVGRFIRKREGEPGRGLAVKYVLLGLLFIAALAGIQLVWLFDPITIFVRTFSFTVHPFANNALERAFAFLMSVTGSPAWLEGFYFGFQQNVLDISHPRFSHAALVTVVFLTVLVLVIVRRRFWCRYICPLGAMLGLASRAPFLRRKTSGCPSGCSLCRDVCRTNAIRSDNSCAASECVMCMDCVSRCPRGNVSFSFRHSDPGQKGNALQGEPVHFGSDGSPLPPPPSRNPAAPDPHQSGSMMSRGQFLGVLGSTLVFLSGAARRTAGRIRTVIRPPGALPEQEFVQRCVRCGNCMKVCLTNALHPALLESGLDGVWTPRLNTKIAYCEYQCTLCTQVCPTGAIRSLSVEEKRRTKLGLAAVDRSICIPWSSDQSCLVCEEHCPIPEKAIKVQERVLGDGTKIGMPVIDRGLCVGCAICENKCPVTPKKAVRVSPL